MGPDLLEARMAFSAATLDNIVYFFGKISYNMLSCMKQLKHSLGGYVESKQYHYSDIFTFDPIAPIEESWKNVSQMKERRMYYALAIIPNVDKICP